MLSTAEGSRRGTFGPVEWALLTGVALVWGSSFILIRISLESLAPATITWVRLTLGFLVLIAIPAARTPIERNDYPRLVLLGFTWLAVPFLLYSIAQQHIDTALAGMLFATVPIFSMSIAMVLLRSLPRLGQAVGIALGFVGAVSIGLPAARSSSAAAWGIFLILVATLSHGVSLNLAVPLQHRYGAPCRDDESDRLCNHHQRTLRAGQLAMGHRSGAGRGDAGGHQHTGIAFLVMTAFVDRAGPTRGGVAIYFIPVVAMVIGMVFRSEVILPLQWAGTAVVLTGAWFASRREA